MITRDNVFHACCALAIAVSAIVGIGVFWAVVLLGVLSEPHAPTSLSDTSILAFKDNYFMVAGAILGTLLSVGWAFFQYRREIRKEREAAKSALIERLKFNDDRAVQMLGRFAANDCPTFLFDTTGIIVWLSKSASLFKPETIAKVNWHRYQLDHLNAMLQPHYVIIGHLDLHVAYKIRQVLVVRSKICGHLEEVHSGLPEVLRMIESDRQK